jgi:hypothetical protein
MSKTEILVADRPCPAEVSEAVLAAREIASAPEPSFRDTEKLEAERRAHEEKLKDARKDVRLLVGSLHKARWKAVAVIVDAIRWQMDTGYKVRLDLGKGIDPAEPEPLIEYVLEADFEASDKGPALSQLIGVIKYALDRREIGDVYEWIAAGKGLDAVYRSVVAKPQQNPRQSKTATTAAAECAAEATTETVSTAKPAVVRPAETIEPDTPVDDEPANEDYRVPGARETPKQPPRQDIFDRLRGKLNRIEPIALLAAGTSNLPAEPFAAIVMPDPWSGAWRIYGPIRDDDTLIDHADVLARAATPAGLADAAE